MPFTPINTQEEFDNAIRDRLARERAKYADYDDLKGQVATLTAQQSSHESAMAESKKQLDTLTSQLAEANAKVKTGEIRGLRMSAAVNNGLPLTLADRISGEDEASINADAQALAQIFGKGHQAPPLANSEPSVDKKEAAMRAVVKNL